MLDKNNQTVESYESADTEETVSKQLANDLAKFLQSSSEPKKFLKSLSNKMGVHEKTLSRILNQENKPHYMTVMKIYRYILSEFDDSKVIQKAPEVIRKYLIFSIPTAVEKDIQYFSSIDKDIQGNPVFAEMYVLAGSGALKKTDIIQRFGKYGIEILEQMLTKKVLAEIRAGEFVLGPNQTNLTPETVLSLGIQLSQSYAKPENGYEMKNHFFGFFAEGLTEAAYQRWVKIDEEAYFKKLELVKDPYNLGSKKAFTFQITETLEPREKK
jgi:hypothetical protein